MKKLLVALSIGLCGLSPLLAEAARIQDLAEISGVRSNPLIGYGLVVGLDGTGDQTTQTPFTTQSLQSLLQQLGVQMSASNLQLKNVAAVLVTAQLPAFATPGQTVDVTVSSMGNAASLRGGQLVMTPLKAADGQIYALAQGPVIVGGYGASGQNASSQVNSLRAGRVPNGAQVERATPGEMPDGPVRLQLHRADFNTAARIVSAINRQFPGQAKALNAREVQVRAPESADARVAFVAGLQNLEVTPGTAPAKVVIDARSGTVVFGGDVQLLPAAISHGSLTVTISDTPAVSQPNPLSAGQTAVTKTSAASATEAGGHVLQLPAATSLAQLSRALNSLGAGPTELVAILQALQAAGSLRASLELL